MAFGSSTGSDKAMAFEGRDTEITLSVGNLLMIFFGLVLLCAAALGVGYRLGSQAGRQNAAAAVAPAAAQPATSSAGKPGAAQIAQAKPADCPVGSNCGDTAVAQTNTTSTQAPAAAAQSTQLTFYDTVQKKDAHPQLAPVAQPAAATKPAAQPTLGAGYMVQISAMRNESDARLLSETLQKQHYPVLVVQPGDHLFHVQVGPYADIHDAEDVRNRLQQSGYNAFVKR
jgi:cell division septation protein DedD